MKAKETDKYNYCNHYHELTEDQKIVDFGTGNFVADREMIPLLRELNRCGLITRSHCSGHDGNHSFIAISKDNITDIQIRNRDKLTNLKTLKTKNTEDKELNEILIEWVKPKTK
jgi:hypothetical protein